MDHDMAVWTWGEIKKDTAMLWIFVSSEHAQKPTPLLHTQTHAEMIGLVFALRAI